MGPNFLKACCLVEQVDPGCAKAWRLRGAIFASTRKVRLPTKNAT